MSGRMVEGLRAVREVEVELPGGWGVGIPSVPGT